MSCVKFVAVSNCGINASFTDCATSLILFLKGLIKSINSFHFVFNQPNLSPKLFTLSQTALKAFTTSPLKDLLNESQADTTTATKAASPAKNGNKGKSAVVYVSIIANLTPATANLNPFSTILNANIALEVAKVMPFHIDIVLPKIIICLVIIIFSAIKPL